MTGDELDSAIASARSVRLSRVGDFDPKNRSRGKTLAIEADAGALHELRVALAIDARSLAGEFAWMTPGWIELHFLDGKTLLASVALVDTEWVRWRAWGFDARLTAPARLATWLAARGFVWPLSRSP